MTTTTTTMRPRGARKISLAWIAPGIVVVAALALIVMLSGSMPARETITVVNRTGAEVTVSTSDAQRTGGSASARSTPRRA